MLLRPTNNNSQWLIVVFPPMLYFTYDFMPLYLDKDQGQYVVKDWYPNAVTSIWVPCTMDAVMQSLRKKVIGCHCCHHILLQNIGAIALQHGALTLRDHFSSESHANDYFITVIIDAYLTTILHEFKNPRKSRRLKRKIPTARRKWLVKRDLRRQAEAYLGPQPFPYELRRSCEEFYLALRKEWGFSPKKLLLMK